MENFIFQIVRYYLKKKNSVLDRLMLLVVMQVHLVT